MGLVTLTNPLTGGTLAVGEQVRANDDAIVAVVNGFIDDSNIVTGAAINGLKISNVAGARIRNDRMDDDSVDSRVLDDDPAVGSPTAAVTANHIRGGAVTTEKLAAGAVTTAKIFAGSVTPAEIAANAIIASKLKLTTFTWLLDAGEGLVNDRDSIFLSTGVGSGSYPLNYYTQSAFTPDGNEREVVLRMHFNTGTSLWYVSVQNNSGAAINFAISNMTVIVNFVAAV